MKRLNDTFFQQYPSFTAALEVLTKNDRLRDILFSGAAMGGTELNRISSNLLNPKSEFANYKNDQPFYPEGGNGALANKLVNIIRKNQGEIIYSCRVMDCKIKNGLIHQIKTDRGMYSAPIVISNLDIKTTYLTLVGNAHLPSHTIRYLNSVHPSLPVNSIYIKFKKLFLDKPNVATFLRSEDCVNELNMLSKGFLPKFPNFGLHIPTLIQNESHNEHFGTLQFYCPSVTHDEDIA